MEDQNSIKEQVKQRYAREANRVRQNSGSPSTVYRAPKLKTAFNTCKARKHDS